ncbi:Variable outer membrane protein (plasmid) [Borrelia crocidurae DOU]|uniref:Variable large protein n=1 Tax=Borrelia crocidurae DOU TaxID=1293575 RepID=W5SMG1_9SPIR|nr:Variable outer membrane protein [Borrelia crocidurae DOU]
MSKIPVINCSTSIGAVSRVDILQAIAAVGEAANNDVGIDQAKNAAGIASAKKEDNKDLSDSVKKDSIIAAGIALRAMSKSGKFAAKAEEKAANAVNGAVASAVNKVLSTLVMGIRNRVDLGLKEINKVFSRD